MAIILHKHGKTTTLGAKDTHTSGLHRTLARGVVLHTHDAGDRFAVVFMGPKHRRRVVIIEAPQLALAAQMGWIEARKKGMTQNDWEVTNVGAAKPDYPLGWAVFDKAIADGVVLHAHDADDADDCDCGIKDAGQWAIVVEYDDGEVGRLTFATERGARSAAKLAATNEDVLSVELYNPEGKLVSNL